MLLALRCATAQLPRSYRTPTAPVPMNGSLRLRPTRRRLVHHLAIAASVAGGGGGVVLLLGSEDWMFLLSMASAYTSLGLLGVTLLLGPWNVLRARPNPVSTHLRRDVGIWAAVLALLHVGLGLQIHFKGSMELYFLFPPGRGLIPLRHDAFGIVNWLGLVAGVIALVLLGISNDLALRKLGTRRWKTVQRWNYVLFGLVIIHGAGYQLIEDRAAPWVAAVVAVAVVVVAFQALGYRIGSSRDTRGSPL